MTDPFVLANPEWCLGQGIITEEEYGAIVNSSEEVGETAKETSSPGSDDSVIVVNGKTYTKSELKKLLE